jgi:hypothetical protein
MSIGHLNIHFRRSLVGAKLDEWTNLVAKISNINLTEGRYKFIWNLQKKMIYSPLNVFLYDRPEYTL